MILRLAGDIGVGLAQAEPCAPGCDVRDDLVRVGRRSATGHAALTYRSERSIGSQAAGSRVVVAGEIWRIELAADREHRAAVGRVFVRAVELKAGVPGERDLAAQVSPGSNGR